METLMLKVVSEHYLVSGIKDRKFGSPGEAVRAALLWLVESNANCTTVQRVTVHEPYESQMFGTQNEKVTGEVTVWGPTNYTNEPALSRYHPVNGWVLPQTVEVEPLP